MSKYRLSFVTNSSSSSYVCDVCGSVESGWDMGLSEAEMHECVNGHTVCDHHIDFSDEAREKALVKLLEEFDYDYYLERDYFTNTYGKTKEEVIHNVQNDEDIRDEFVSNHMEDRYNLPAELCPICNHEIVMDNDVIEFAAKKLDIDVEDLRSMTREYLIALADK